MIFDASGDWNNYRNFGFYSGYNLANAPCDGWVQVFAFPLNGNPNYTQQYAFENNAIYVRKDNDGSFESWSRIV